MNIEAQDRSGRDILNDLTTPGRTLIFVDDGGTSGKPLPNLAADFEVICGVLLESATYVNVKKQMLAQLSAIGHGVDEFHATEIVNPPSDSAWRPLPTSDRLNVLRTLFDVLKTSATTILHCFVSGEQYNAELKSRIAAAGVRPRSTKATLKHVFYNSLVLRIETTGEQFAIVADSSIAQQDALRIQAVRNPAPFLEGGVIYVDSRHEPGVQLADLAAYTLNRIHHSRQRLVDGRGNAFDELIVDAAFELLPKFVNVLDTAPEPA